MNKPLKRQLKKVLDEGLHGFKELGQASNMFVPGNYKDTLKPLNKNYYIEFDDISKKSLLRLLGLYVWLNIVGLIVSILVNIVSFTSVLTNIVSIIWIVLIASCIGIAFGLLEKQYKIKDFGAVIWVVVEALSVLSFIGSILSIVGRVSAFMLMHSPVIMIRTILDLIYLVVYAAIIGTMIKCKVLDTGNTNT